MQVSIRSSQPLAPKAPPVRQVAERQTFDAGGSWLPAEGVGKLVRAEGDGPSGDVVADAAHDNAGIVRDFLSSVLGRNSIDGRGMPIQSVVHFGEQHLDATWDGEKMRYGDGDGKLLAPTAQALDIVAHELSHGVVEYTAGLRYRDQPGALNESWADVFGEVIEQWSENRAGFGSVDAARAADWLIGEDVFTPGTAGDAIRSMRAPGTAHVGDLQPAHMRDYVQTADDNGGVHFNSGIANRAAYEVATRIGSEKLAHVWYDALTDHLRPDAQFADAARATIAAATARYGAGVESQAVQDAWKAVGVL